MSGGFQFFDIILFAMIAIFIVLRLRSVLGRRTGQEERDANRFSRTKRSVKRPGNVINLPDRSDDRETDEPDAKGRASKWRRAEPGSSQDETPRAAQTAAEPKPTRPDKPAGGGSSVDLGLTQISIADPEFNRRSFLHGAQSAFEMIVEAFARADSAALRPLLADDLYDQFVEAIRERLAKKQRLETTLIGVRGAEILEAALEGRTAKITVKFVTEQINVMRDADDEIVAGDETKVAPVTDIWMFSRNTRSRDPNWLLAETRSLT